MWFSDLSNPLILQCSAPILGSQSLSQLLASSIWKKYEYKHILEEAVVHLQLAKPVQCQVQTLPMLKAHRPQSSSISSSFVQAPCNGQRTLTLSLPVWPRFEPNHVLPMRKRRKIMHTRCRSSTRRPANSQRVRYDGCKVPSTGGM